MDKDELKGKVDQAKGWVKEKAGEITDDPELQIQGKVDKASGKVREASGKAKRRAEDALDETQKALEDDEPEVAP